MKAIDECKNFSDCLFAFPAHARRIVLFFLLAFFFAGRAHAQTPTISSVNPNTGGVGQTVAVQGSNFGSSQGSSTVKFNGVATAATTWTNTYIAVTVPSGATTGNVVVTMGGVASNGYTFTVITTPFLSGLTPTTGGVGQVVAVFGSNFGPSQGTSTVKFNGVAATATTWTSTYIAVTVPSGATTGNVVVTAGGVASNGYPFTVVTTPNISGIAPSYAAVGQSVTIGGSNFGSSPGTSTVTFNGTAVTATQWANTFIVVTVPSGATTGNVVVTVGGVASNGWNFGVSHAPAITSANNATFAVGSAGSFTVTASGYPASTFSETGTLPSGVTFTSASGVLSGTPATGTAGSYPITFTASNGITPNATQSFTLTVAAPPTITASASPAANASGWNNSNVTVTYTCTAGSLPITGCPSPQTVSFEGRGQIVSGTVTDTAGDSATARVTINLDKTIPVLTVASPADQTIESASPVTVSGTLTDALSGVSGVTCNGVTATLSGGSFSCNISLTVGVNLVVIRGTDIAGNVAGDNFHLSLTGTLPVPTSLQVTPTGVNMVVEGTQQFTAVDQLGRPRTDATWTISSTTIATIDTNSSPTLTAVSVGTATLTATVGTTTANTVVTVGSGTSLSQGTVTWSQPAISGFTGRQIVQGTSPENSPALYSVMSDSTGTNTLITALTPDGQQLWTSATLSGYPWGGFGDG